MRERHPDSRLDRRWAWAQQLVRDHELSRAAAAAGMIIADHINSKTGDAWPSLDTLGTLLHISPRAVQKLIPQLVDRGHLVVVAGRGRGHSSRYRIVLKEAIPKHAPEVRGYSQSCDGQKTPAEDVFTDRKHELQEPKTRTSRVVKHVPQVRTTLLEDSVREPAARARAEKLAKALGQSLDYLRTSRPSLVQTVNLQIDAWVREGCDEASDIWTTIEHIAARRQNILSLAYFERAIFAARDERLNGWRVRVKAYRSDRFWSDEWGPRPDQVGCRAPRALLEAAE